MNIFWSILIIIGSLLILGIVTFLFFVWAISKGFKKKFGPEWLPAELKITFEYINVSHEDKKTIRYSLSEHETIEIFEQICSLNTNDTYDFIHSSPSSIWIKIDDETFEYRHIKSNKLKAVFSNKNRELIYHK
ncbi:MAG: hypothetical protein RL582_144 [Bacteroidota bacterium]